MRNMSLTSLTTSGKHSVSASIHQTISGESVFPVILGQGKRTFPDTMPAPAKLTITNSRTVGSGVLLLNLTPDQA